MVVLVGEVLEATKSCAEKKTHSNLFAESERFPLLQLGEGLRVVHHFEYEILCAGRKLLPYCDFIICVF